MILKTALETSRFISFIGTSRKLYSYLGRKLAEAYRDSYIYRLLGRFTEMMRLSFRKSFIKKPFGIIEKGNSAILYNSKFAQWMESSYKRLSKGASDNLNMGILGNLTVSVKKEFALNLTRAASVILIAAVVTVLILHFIFQREPSYLGAAIMAIFLILGIAGLYCNADWETVEKGSVILRVLFRWAKRD